MYTFLATKAGSEDCAATVVVSNVGLTNSLVFLNRPGLPPSPTPSNPGDSEPAAKVAR